jgi:hypothetical protein
MAAETRWQHHEHLLLLMCKMLASLLVATHIRIDLQEDWTKTSHMYLGPLANQNSHGVYRVTWHHLGWRRHSKASSARQRPASEIVHRQSGAPTSFCTWQLLLTPTMWRNGSDWMIRVLPRRGSHSSSAEMSTPPASCLRVNSMRHRQYPIVSPRLPLHHGRFVRQPA